MPKTEDGDRKVMSLMSTITGGVVVESNPKALIDPPKGENGTVSIGSALVHDLGRVMCIALHTADGTGMVATLGREACIEFIGHLNGISMQFRSDDLEKLK